MSPWIWFVLWLIIGTLASYLHLNRLRVLVIQSAVLPPGKAEKRLTRFAPLRILAFVPVLLGAAYCGLAGCVGVVVGILVGRVVAVATKSTSLLG